MEQSVTIKLEEYNRLVSVEKEHEAIMRNGVVVVKNLKRDILVIGKKKVVKYVKNNIGNTSDLLKKINELEAKRRTKKSSTVWIP